MWVLPQEGDEAVDEFFGHVEDAKAGKLKGEVRVSAAGTMVRVSAAGAMVKMSEVGLLVALCLRFVVRWRIE